MLTQVHILSIEGVRVNKEKQGCEIKSFQRRHRHRMGKTLQFLD